MVKLVSQNWWQMSEKQNEVMLVSVLRIKSVRLYRTSDISIFDISIFTTGTSSPTPENTFRNSSLTFISYILCSPELWQTISLSWNRVTCSAKHLLTNKRYNAEYRYFSEIVSLYCSFSEVIVFAFVCMNPPQSARNTAAPFFLLNDCLRTWPQSLLIHSAHLN